MNKIVRVIHAHVDETVEIVWHRPSAEVHILRERYTAPPLETWKARTAAEDVQLGDRTP
jgi:hypothetical protein